MPAYKIRLYESRYLGYYIVMADDGDVAQCLVAEGVYADFDEADIDDPVEEIDSESEEIEDLDPDDIERFTKQQAVFQGKADEIAARRAKIYGEGL